MPLQREREADLSAGALLLDLRDTCSLLTHNWPLLALHQAACRWQCCHRDRLLACRHCRCCHSSQLRGTVRKAKRVAVEAMTTGTVVLPEDPSDRLRQEARGAAPALAKVDNHRASEADSNWPSIGPCSGSVTAGVAHNQTRVRVIGLRALHFRRM